MGWFYASGGLQKGPVSDEEMDRLSVVGEIDASTLVWREGMPGWQPQHEVRPAVPVSKSPPPGLGMSGAERCSSCSAEAEAGDLVVLGGRPYCSRCKGLVLQNLRERGQLDLTEGGPKGVGGWLLFFCVGLTILQPALFVLATVGGFAALSQQPTGIPPLVYWDTAIMTIFVGASAVVGARIWAGHAQGRRLALRLLYVRLPYLVIGNALGLLFFVEPAAYSNPTFIGAIIGNLLREVFYFAIWVSYFKRSKRVRNTYGPD